MRLQNLEIKGFKSFADKTVINFNNNIIGVVGPNGCGKSNIVDSIRWVLGEQKSKELRSEKMSNVIFNGTKKRRPGGLAQVSLTFDNDKSILPTEYSKVTITRILYRTGESEYRLNGVTCRLKDIKSLLLDTGIGSNSYAIIALGMVDDLLNDRDNARRKLFEQAAGISKYKSRKKETLRKLKGTTTDLDRVEDLLFEIEGNVKKLERQAKRAKKYFEIKGQYKVLSIELAVFEVAQFKEDYKSLEQKIKTEEDKLLGADTQLKTLEANLQQEKNKNLDKEKALSTRQQALSRTIGTIRSQENEKKVLAQKLLFVQQNKTNVSKDIVKTQEQIEQTEQDIEYYRSEINTEKRIEETLENQLDNAEEKLQKIKGSHGNVKEELDTFIQKQQRLERHIFSLEKEKAINQSQITNLERDIERNEIDFKRRQQEILQLEGQLETQSQRQTEKEQLLLTLEREEEQRITSLEDQEKQLDKVREDLVKVNRSLDSKRNEYNLIKSLVDNLEGFPESIKFLSKNSKWDKKAPLLSDVFYCDAPYRAAIENYLEPYLSYYVVQNLEEAVQAIQLLDRSKKGKANFFLLDKFKKGTTPNLPKINNTIEALSVVEMDDKYTALGQQLLGNVLINENDDFTNQNFTDDTILLSKSGKYIQKQFSISGGSVGTFEGKRIGRKKNLAILEKEITALKLQSETLKDSRVVLQKGISQTKSQDKRRQIQREKDQLNRIKQTAVSVQTKLENFGTFLKEMEVKKTQFEQRIEIFQQKNIAIEKDLTLQSVENQSLIDEISKKDGSYRVIADKLSKASQDYNQQNIAFIKQQNKITTLQRELTYREKQVRDLTVRLQTNQANLKRSEKELIEVQETIVQIDEELKELYGKKLDNQAYLTHAEEVYFASRGSINELEENIRNFNRQRQSIQQLITALKDKFNEVKLQLNSIGERLRIEFEMNVNDIINQTPNEEYNVTELREQVTKLKKRLNNYGEINPMAVEAFDEMTERYTFIKTQRDDLLQAKKTLLETIKEIETNATALFLDAFNQVREHFKTVFRSLFTEDDDCDLILEDPTNPLDTTIKIVAKPKGKRPQTINQLSGGEKTLTATALLFSLYLLKPAPFCIFDEVDAPLDDANISKFNKIIQKFSENSQFIIVTHNKQTMASVDVIYGVTMEEQGVSKVVPVDFRTLAESM